MGADVMASRYDHLLGKVSITAEDDTCDVNPRRFLILGTRRSGKTYHLNKVLIGATKIIGLSKFKDEPNNAIIYCSPYSREVKFIEGRLKEQAASLGFNCPKIIAKTWEQVRVGNAIRGLHPLVACVDEIPWNEGLVHGKDFLENFHFVNETFKDSLIVVVTASLSTYNGAVEKGSLPAVEQGGILLYNAVRPMQHWKVLSLSKPYESMFNTLSGPGFLGAL